MADTGKEKSGSKAEVVVAQNPAIPPTVPGPDQTGLYFQRQPQQYPEQGFYQQRNQGTKMNFSIGLVAKIVTIAELVLVSICGLAWVVFLGMYIHGSIEFYDRHKSRSDQYRDRDRYNDYDRYDNFEYRAPGDGPKYSHHGGIPIMLGSVTLGFTVHLGLMISLGIGIFRKSFELCIVWLSGRIPMFFFEFTVFVFLCGDRFPWWVILLTVVYLIYRIITIGALAAFGFKIYQSRNKVNPDQTM